MWIPKKKTATQEDTLYLPKTSLASTRAPYLIGCIYQPVRYFILILEFLETPDPELAKEHAYLMTFVDKIFRMTQLSVSLQ